MAYAANSMKVVIDSERCTGHGRCYSLSPEVFNADDTGYGVVAAEGDLDAEHLMAAERAVANCPERAVSMRHEGDHD